MNKMSQDPSIPPVEDKPDEATVRDLVRRSRAGEEDAFSGLMTMYYGKTFGIAYGMVSSVEDAKDLNQRIWAKVWKHLDGFREESGFYTWLYRIATRQCIDFIRKERRSPFVEPFADEREPRETRLPAPESARPDRMLISQDRLDRFERALQQLSPDHRMALTLREIEGLSYEEIAVAMDSRKGTVMSRLHHARRKVREIMEQEDEV